MASDSARHDGIGPDGGVASLLWFGGVLLSHIYALEQARLLAERQTEGGGGGRGRTIPLRAATPRVVVRVLEAPSSDAGASPAKLLRGHSREAGMSSKAVPVEEDPTGAEFTPTVLFDTFEQHFFPYELFKAAPGSTGSPHPETGSPALEEAPTEEELRLAFREFIALGQHIVRRALFHHHPSATRAGGGRNRSGDRSGPATQYPRGDTDMVLSGEESGGAETLVDPSTVATMIQVVLSLAFSCPCAALASAVQLILAESFARVPRAQVASMCGGVLRYLPVLSQQPADGDGVVAAHSSKAAARSRQAVSPPGVRVVVEDEDYGEYWGAADGGATPLRPRAPRQRLDHLPTTLHLLDSDELVWFDWEGRAHAEKVSEWQGRSERHGDGVTAATSTLWAFVAPLPATTVLPLTERLVIEGNEAEVEALQGVLYKAVRAHRGAKATRHFSFTSPTLESGSIDPHFPKRRRGNASGISSSLTRIASGDWVEQRHDDPESRSPPDTGHRSKSSVRRRSLLYAMTQARLFQPHPRRAVAQQYQYSIFTHSGECPNYYGLLAMYPDVLRAHHAAHQYILFGSGPLPIKVRLMIAITAASRHRCEYLVSRLAALLVRYESDTEDPDGEENEEEHSDGDDCSSEVSSTNSTGGGDYGNCGVRGAKPCGADRASTVGLRGGTSLEFVLVSEGGAAEWLLHGSQGPMRSVQHFIALVTHTPWNISADTVRALVSEGWTIPELFHLTAIVAHIVPLCSFVMGLFVPSEPWTAAALPPAVSAHFQHHALRSTRQSGIHSTSSPENLYLDPATAEEEATANFFARLAGFEEIVSEQRIRSGSSTAHTHTLWKSQFSWSDRGSAVMEQYYPGAVAHISEELDCFEEVVHQLSEPDCVGLKGAEFSPAYAFRSMQLYVLNLLGYMVEDYPYNDINKVLRRPPKWFAQTLIMRPEALTREAVVHWWVSASTGASSRSDHPPLAAPSTAVSLATHQSSREKELLELVQERRTSGSGRGEDASATRSEKTAEEEAEKIRETTTLETALALQNERALLLISLATMEARKEGLLNLMCQPLCAVLSNM